VLATRGWGGKGKGQEGMLGLDHANLRLDFRLISDEAQTDSEVAAGAGPSRHNGRTVSAAGAGGLEPRQDRASTRGRRPMAATDGQIVVAAARWADEATYLREFVAKYRLPVVIKITKGQYGGLGVPTLPAPSLQSTVLLVSAGRRRKIVAQAVKIKVCLLALHVLKL
jgi:hypothetical protein